MLMNNNDTDISLTRGSDEYCSATTEARLSDASLTDQ